jgi:hypothetical protein
MEDSQVKQEPKLNMNNTTTDDIKVKEEPVESEEEQPQPQTDLLSASIQSESLVVPTNKSKSKETKKLYRKFFSNKFHSNSIVYFFFLALLFTCDDCGIRYSNRSTLDAHREHYCTKREITKSHSTGK